MTTRITKTKRSKYEFPCNVSFTIFHSEPVVTLKLSADDEDEDEDEEEFEPLFLAPKRVSNSPGFSLFDEVEDEDPEEDPDEDDDPSLLEESPNKLDCFFCFDESLLSLSPKSENLLPLLLSLLESLENDDLLLLVSLLELLFPIVLCSHKRLYCNRRFGFRSLQKVQLEFVKTEKVCKDVSSRSVSVHVPSFLRVDRVRPVFEACRVPRKAPVRG